MRNHGESGKTMRLYNLMLSGIDCVLENVVEVKQKQTNAKGCQVIPWLRMRAATSNLLRERMSEAEGGEGVDESTAESLLTRRRRRLK